jgi:hypothetical protein
MFKQKQGEVSTGVILVLFIGIIVSLALMSGIYAPIGQTTATQTLNNAKYTAPAAGSCIDLVGQELLSTPTVINRTGDAIAIPAANYTITERVSSVDGLKRVAFCTVGTLQAPYSTLINVSYSYGAEGYADDSGSRSIIGLLILLAAIAIAIWVIKPVLEDRGVFG